MLGEGYRPRGLALETARAVLEMEDPHACNVALGCSNRCGYCYVPKYMRLSLKEGETVRQPSKPPVDLVSKQLMSFTKCRRLGNYPTGVFLSFLTDPFLKVNVENTEQLINWLVVGEGIRVATCSKLAVSVNPSVRHGMTIVSLNGLFHKEWEPYTLYAPLRIKALEETEGYTWGSMEPYPCSAIFKQNIEDVLEPLHFLDLIVFGKWNYDRRASTDLARLDYIRDIAILRDFCKENSIRLHIKSDTLKFIGETT